MMNHEETRQVLDALQDILSGWNYIQQGHPDLYGVGWDRARSKSQAAIALCEASLARAVEPVAQVDEITRLADEYATAVVEFSRRIAAGADSMSPLAVEAGDKRAALFGAIEALAASKAVSVQPSQAVEHDYTWGKVKETMQNDPEAINAKGTP